MNIVTISTLYPNSVDPKHGIFVQARLRHLLKSYPDVKAQVIAPVPWFPFSHRIFGSYAKFAKIPKKEVLQNITVYHPRYLVLPKIGMYLTPWFLARAVRKALQKLVNQGEKIELIDGHYYYPDGVAITNAAKQFDLPFVCTARGTDITLIPQFSRARIQILGVFRQSQKNLAVCQALADEMITLGAEKDTVQTLRNGVDLQLFTFADEERQQQQKRQLNVTGNLILSVGRLVELKGQHLIIDALARLRGQDITLMIVGEGEMADSLKQQAGRLGLSQQVRFVGPLAQEYLKQYYQAADALVLGSSREGWANVLLEAMACGTPVVATRLWGTPEVVQVPEAGLLVERDANSIGDGIRRLLANPPKRSATRRYAEGFSWDATSAAQYQLFKKITGHS